MSCPENNYPERTMIMKKKVFKRVSSLILVLALVLGISVTAAAKSVSMEEAKEIAYTDAGVSAESVTSIDKLIQYRSGRSNFYKFIFRTDSTKYVYIIRTDGTIIKNESVKINSSGSHHSTTAKNSVKLSRDEALEIAIKYAKTSEAKLRECDIELEKEKGVYYYEVELETKGGKEYEYCINAETGEVYTSCSQLLLAYDGGTGAFITENEALAIAMKHAKLSDSAIKCYEAELDEDDGIYCYEIEFSTTGGKKYEYEIDAITGDILEHECKR